MKKSIFLLMILSSMIAFYEKLTTNGKDNLDKLKGNWDSIQATISNTPKGWYILSYDEPDYKLYRFKPGVLYFNPSDKYNKANNIYIAWDTKYKTLVTVDKNLNIIKREKRHVDCLHNNTCN